MSSIIDLEAQQVAQAAPPRHVPVRFSLFLITVEVVTARKEEVEGAETHEMDIQGGPHTSSVASSLQSVSTGQDINEEAAQSVVSQAEGVSSIWPCCLIPGRLFCSVTGSGGSDVPEMNIDHWQSHSRDDVSHTIKDRHIGGSSLRTIRAGRTPTSHHTNGVALSNYKSTNLYGTWCLRIII
jgi:hypothetical protein